MIQTTNINIASSFVFSEKSIQLLNTVNKELGILATEVLKISKIRFEITEGWRDQTTQQKYFREGKSQLDGINRKSKHQEGKAIDIICYIPEIDKTTKKPTGKTVGTWEQKYYYYIAGLFEVKSKEMIASGQLKTPITWGGWWSFEDCVHFELV